MSFLQTLFKKSSQEEGLTQDHLLSLLKDWQTYRQEQYLPALNPLDETLSDLAKGKVKGQAFYLRIGRFLKDLGYLSHDGLINLSPPEEALLIQIKDLLGAKGSLKGARLF